MRQNDGFETQAAFLAASPAELRPFVPQTAVFAAGGTRRSAVLAGLSTDGFTYVQFARTQMYETFDLLFRYGVKHIFTAVSTHVNFGESGAYQTKLLQRVANGVADDDALAVYQQKGWRVRLAGGEDVPELQTAVSRLQQATPTGNHTLWYTIAPRAEAPWEQLLAAAHRAQATTRAELIRELYGEDIPLATMYLGFGKPEIYADLVPPVLVGKMQCYIRQKPGYLLSEQEWRLILYDYAFTRATWREDKTGRELKVLDHREAWENAPILGLGKRLGPFWYPLSGSDDEE
ncbi:MAG: hypothetical protein KDE56_03055 [Anaerolineales bacterium]|nr:hypothetical protein [Anaerolineales bacterium]